MVLIASKIFKNNPGVIHVATQGVDDPFFTAQPPLLKLYLLSGCRIHIFKIILRKF